jgi:hypothetical protein
MARTVESYIIFWKKDKINRILANGDTGPLSVLYGGEHQSQPTFGKVGVGDTVFPFTIIDGTMYLLGRMVIDEIADADRYIAEVLKIRNPEHMWDTYWYKHPADVNHKIPTTCADKVAVGRGSALKKRIVPQSVAAQLRVGVKPGAEALLKTKDGKFLTTGLIGYYRRLSADSAAILDTIIDNDKEDHARGVQTD